MGYIQLDFKGNIDLQCVECYVFNITISVRDFYEKTNRKNYLNKG